MSAPAVRLGHRRAMLSVAVTAIIRGGGATAIVALYYVIARLYPKQESADFFVLLTVTSVATPVLMYGYNVVTVRLLAPINSASTLRKTYTTLLRRFLKLSLPSTVLAAAATLIVTRGSFLALIVVVTIVCFIPLFSFFGYAMQGVRAYNQSILTLNVVNFVFIGALAVVQSAVDPSWVTYREQITSSFCIASVLTLAIAALLWARLLARWDDSASESTAGSTANAKLLVVWLIYILVAANNWVPQGLYYLGGARTDYAYFSVAQRMANVVGFFIIVANFMLGPRIARLSHEHRTAELRSLYIRAVRITSVLALPVSAVLVFAPQLVLGLFGGGYVGGAKYLSLLAAVQFFNVATGSSNQMLIMTGHQRDLLIAMGSALFVGLAFLGIIREHLGGFGFALTVAVTLVWQNVAALWFVRRRLGIRFFDILRPLKALEGPG